MKRNKGKKSKSKGPKDKGKKGKGKGKKEKPGLAEKIKAAEAAKAAAAVKAKLDDENSKTLGQLVHSSTILDPNDKAVIAHVRKERDGHEVQRPYFVKFELCPCPDLPLF